MSTRRHPRYPADQWQAWIEEQARSGLSQRVFCEQKGLSKSSFQLWKRRLRSAGVAAPPSSRHSDAESALFAPVMAPETEDADHDVHGWEIELDLGDGVCLRFRRGGR
jgi:transposase